MPQKAKGTVEVSRRSSERPLVDTVRDRKNSSTPVASATTIEKGAGDKSKRSETNPKGQGGPPTTPRQHAKSLQKTETRQLGNRAVSGPSTAGATDFSRRSEHRSVSDLLQSTSTANFSGVSNRASDSDSDDGRSPNFSSETPYRSTSGSRNSGIQIPQLTLSSVQAQVKFEEEDVVHQPTSSSSTLSPRPSVSATSGARQEFQHSPHISTAPNTFIKMSEIMGPSYDGALLTQEFTAITSNGNAGLVPAGLSANRSVISHNKTALVDVGCDASSSGQRLPQPWAENGKLSMQYVTNKERKKLHGMRCADQLFAEDREIMLQADSDAEKLHASRTFYEPAPVDFRSLLNDGESMIMQIKCKGFVGVPSTGGHVVGDCWLILTRMTLNDEEYRRIYFYQPQHMNKSYKMQESTHDHRCMCCVGQDSAEIAMANRTEEAYLDMITVEDQLVHAHYEQMKRTTVEKKSKSRGKYLRPACLRNLVGNCPSCSLDLCQAAEDDHCTLPLCCCISCVVPSRCCRPGYAKLESSLEPHNNLNDVVTRISCLKTEKPEKSHQASDVLHTINRMETTNVEQSDFYAISLNFAFPNRGRLKECLAIVCPSESVSKSLKFVMLVTQKPTLLDAPAGSQVEFKAVHSKDSALLRCKARGDYKPPPLHHAACEAFTNFVHRLFCPNSSSQY